MKIMIDVQVNYSQVHHINQNADRVVIPPLDQLTTLRSAPAEHIRVNGVANIRRESRGLSVFEEKK